jgi:hypothetical protein
MLKKRNEITGRYVGGGSDGHSCKVCNPADLPAEFGCWKCNETKPLVEMLVVHLKREGVYYVRPRCKDCHNKQERGHRREWKRKYLQGWRKRNAAATRSYWYDVPNRKEKARVQMARHIKNNHDAILIRGRINRRGGDISLQEARELLERFGRCYPSRFGLTPEGLQQVERLRKKPIHNRLTMTELRIMAYEDGLFIAPERQPIPYQSAAEKLRRWQRDQRQLRAAA